jgi:hypothetical protein
VERIGFILVAAGALFLPSASITSTAQPLPAVGSPTFMTYWEARAAGLGVSALPSETGFRVCTPADFKPGFKTAEEAERAAAEYDTRWGEAGPDICQVDPTTAVIAVWPRGNGNGLMDSTGVAEREPGSR